MSAFIIFYGALSATKGNLALFKLIDENMTIDKGYFEVVLLDTACPEYNKDIIAYINAKYITAV